MAVKIIQIVVIGGGYGGMATAQTLSSNLSHDEAKIIVIEKNEFQFHAVGTPRALVDANFDPKLYIPLKNALPNNKNAQVIRAIAEEINHSKQVTIRRVDDNDVLSETTEMINYDYLIIATGSTYPTPMKPSIGSYTKNEIQSHITETRSKIMNAERILIIGAGSVGVEVAGEIAVAYPNKKVIMIDGNDQVISRQKLTDKFRTKLTTGLKNLKVEIMFNEKLDDRMKEHGYETKTIQTLSGKSITSDVQLVCAGMHPITTLMNNFDKSTISENGNIKVDANLQVTNHSDIFVVGDASNHPTPKMAYMAGQQGKHLGKNLASHIRSDKEVIKPFDVPKTEAIIVPLGPNG